MLADVSPGPAVPCFVCGPTAFVEPHSDLLVTGAEMSAVLRTCQSCCDRRAIGEHRSYPSVGVVLRCPACEDVALVLGMQEKRLVVEWRALYDIAR